MGVFLFIVEDNFGLRINAIEVKDVDVVKQRCRNKELFCPECKGPIEFRAGLIKKPYFAHKDRECTYSYGEPESEQHMNGKLKLAKWLEDLYPNSHVELEWKIKETNQRSDVIIIHPNGEKWAIEFQCSPIPGVIWEERHELYKTAGIKDFWILGAHFNNWVQDNLPNFYLRRDLERSIYNTYQRVYYLDSNSDNYCFNILRGGDFKSKTILSHPDDFTCLPLEEVSLQGDELWSVHMLKHYADWDRINRLANNPVLFNIVYEYIFRLEELENAINMEEKRKQDEIDRNNYNAFYKQLVDKRNQQYKSLTREEKNLFVRLCQKHEFTFETLPGFLFPEVSHGHMIKTPSFVWQLWVYDRFLHNQTIKQKSKKFPSIWVPNIRNEFKEMRKQRIFKINTLKDDSGGYYIYAIGDFIDYLSAIGITRRKSRKNSEFHEILFDYLKPSENFQESIFVEWYSCMHLANYRIPVGFPDKVQNAWSSYGKTLSSYNEIKER